MLGKVILITGAGAGIGAATAISFASLGARLSICDMNVENLKRTAEKCTAVGKKAPFSITADLTNEEDVQRVADSTIANYSKLDILVNNAGTAEIGPLETTSLGQYDRIFNINVRAVYQLTMLVAPYIIKSKGNIINVSSALTMRPMIDYLAYGMSKSAIDHFTNTLALELGPKGVRVNSINPGVIITPLHKAIVSNKKNCGQPDEYSDGICPLQRPGYSEEVADAIAFLASDKASFVTGINMLIDGGYQLG